MKKSLASIQMQIDALKRQAEEIKRKEVSGVIARIKEAIRHYDLSAADLGFRGKVSASAKSVRQTVRRKKASGSAKYQNPVSGKTWTGHGRRPQWIVEALVAGKTVEDFAIRA